MSTFQTAGWSKPQAKSDDDAFAGIGMTSMRTRERLVNRLIEQGIAQIDILNVFRQLPRHLFVDEALAHRAYEDVSLPIGSGQTISQPYIVAKMTELLLRDGVPQKVLEIGTGSGFQTAVLAMLVPMVYSVERIKSLQDKARERLRALKLHNVQLKYADGTFGWETQAPFDAIMATCAPEDIPDNLYQQLNPEGGRLVIPVGGEHQALFLITRQGGEFEREQVEAVKFVPFQQGTTS